MVYMIINMGAEFRSQHSEDGKTSNSLNKFENLKAKYDECIQDFHMIVLDIANDLEDLGEKISRIS